MLSKRPGAGARRKGETGGERSRARPSRRWVWRLGATALVLLLAYPVAGNLLLNTGWGQRLILPRRSMTTVAWQRAWTLVPGLVHFSGLELQARNRSLYWSLNAESGSAWIDLLALPARRFSVLKAQARDFSCALQAPPGEEPATAPVRKKPWRISLSRVRLERLRSCETGGWRLLPADRGSGSLSGGFDLQIRGPMELRQIALDLENFQLQHEKRPIARISSLAARIDSEPFIVREARGRNLLRPLSGRLELDSETASLGFLNSFLEKAPWFHLSSDSGSLQGSLAFEKGLLLPDSSFSFRSEDLAVRYLDYTARGSASLVGEVEGSTPRLAAAYEGFSLRQEQAEQPYVRGRELTVLIETSDNDLVDAPEVDVTVDLPPSEVPDLAIYNELLPSKAGVEISGGSGTIEAHFTLSTAGSDQSGADSAEMAAPGPGGGVTGEAKRNGGTIELNSTDLATVSGELAMRGRLTASARIADFDGKNRALRLSSAGIALDGMTMSREGEIVRRDWSGRIDLVDGAITLTRPIQGASRLRLALTDIRPILVFFAEQRPKLGTVAKLVNVKDIVGSAKLALGPGGLDIDDLAIHGNRLDLKGRVCLGSRVKSGAIHVRAFGIGLGSWFDGAERRWTALRPERWYEKKLAELDC